MNDLDTNLRQRLPVSLVVLAILFILGGISSVIEVFVSLMRNHININFGVLGIFIGIGLLRLRRVWRTCALVFTWLGLIAAPIIGLLFLNHSGPLDFNVFGEKVGHASKELGIVVVIAFFVYSIWQYRVLTRSDIRLLFFGSPTGGSRPEIRSELFSKFLTLYPEFRLADSHLQRNAFHKWVNSPNRDDATE